MRTKSAMELALITKGDRFDPLTGVYQFPYLWFRQSFPVIIHARMAVDQAHRKLYQFGWQAVTKVQFTIIAQLQAVILGRQPLSTELTPSTTQVGKMVFPHGIKSKKISSDQELKTLRLMNPFMTNKIKLIH